ncbi:MBL fold metallo-hydrolase [Bacillus tianshenii]|nr:MBL fold metallo-hydrolase [Bacillus tianshenii]
MTMKKMTSGEVFEKVRKEEAFFLLDVRNESDFNDWRIDGKKVESLNVPYFELIDGVEGITDKLPKDKDILVVCAKEGSSVMVAEMLSEAGFNVSYLEGGMKSWSEYLHEAVVYEDDKISVYQYIRSGKGCLSYMVVSNGEALVVDPARFVDKYVKLAEDKGAKITHIVDSHLHADHISGGRVLAEQTGAKYYLMKSEGAVFDFQPLETHEKIEFADVTLEVLAVKTPGHTPGSVSFFVNNKLLFSGDTIFVNGLGRPDLGGKAKEWAKDLYNTVYSKISEITDDVIVLPGHYADYDTEVNEEGFIGDTLGNIRKQNDLMTNTGEEEFVEHYAANESAQTPPNFEEIVAINRGELAADVEKQQELEIGPNRCAVHHAG